MKRAVFFALILVFALSADERQIDEKANASKTPKVEPNIAILPAPAVDSK